MTCTLKLASTTSTRKSFVMGFRPWTILSPDAHPSAAPYISRTSRPSWRSLKAFLCSCGRNVVDRQSVGDRQGHSEKRMSCPKDISRFSSKKSEPSSCLCIVSWRIYTPCSALPMNISRPRVKRSSYDVVLVRSDNCSLREFVASVFAWNNMGVGAFAKNTTSETVSSGR